MPTAVPAARRAAVDGCPGAIQVHEAADGGLARIRVPGGVVSRTQWATLHDCAGSLGNGSLELTSRANLQVRGLAVGTETMLARRLASVGLLPSATHERVRNILASPLAVDVRPWVAELDRALCADAALARLPGRFLFAVDDGRGDVSGLGADVTVLPVPTDRVAVLLAGVDSGLRVAPAQAVPALIEAARGFLAERAAQVSDAWRLAELDDAVVRVGARVRAALGLASEVDAAVFAGKAPVPAPVPAPAPAEALLPRARGPVGVLPGPDGLVAIGLVAPLGRLTVDQAARIGAVAPAEVIVTPWRGLVIPGMAAADVQAALAALAGAGLVTDPDSPWAGATACTGLPGCAKSGADVRADATVTLGLAGREPGLRPVHWVGCERRCGRPADAAVEVLAVSGGYQVDGDDVSVDELPAVVAAARRSQ